MGEINFKTIIFTLLFVFNHLFATSQSMHINEIDSLIVEARAAMYKADIDKSLRTSQEALSLSTKERYTEGIVAAYSFIVQALYYQQEYKDALAYIKLAENVKGVKSQPQYFSQILMLKGTIYSDLNLNEKSLVELNKALKVAKNVSDKESNDYVTSRVLGGIARVYYMEGDIESYRSNMNESLKLLNDIDEDFAYPYIINTFSTLGDYNLLDNKPDSVQMYLDKSFSLIDKYDFKYKAHTLRVLGDLYFHMNDIDSSLQAYESAIKNASYLNVVTDMCNVNSGIAKVYNYLNMADSAQVHTHQMLKLENDLLKSKFTAVDASLTQLLRDEMIVAERARVRDIILSVIITFILTSFVLSQVWKRSRRNIIERVEEDVQTELKSKLNVAFDEVMLMAKNNDPGFLFRFQEVYSGFYGKLTDAHPNLTPTELRLCALTYLNLSTRDIAEFTFVEVRSVQTRRSRLRKKIDLPSDVDLFAYLKSLK